MSGLGNDVMQAGKRRLVRYIVGGIVTGVVAIGGLLGIGGSGDKAPEPSQVPATGGVHVTTKPTATPKQSTGGVFYRTCADARKAGKAPLHRGDPGYRPALDKDRDGVACAS